MEQTTRKCGKEAYVTPAVEVISMENEGVIAASGNVPGYNPGNLSSTRTVSPNAASSSDLEEMISDIFTVEN